MDESVDSRACDCSDPGEHKYLLPSGEAGAEIGYVGIENLGRLRIVV